jgi:hypothetical protein
VVVLQTQGRRQPRLVGQTVLRVQQAQVDDRAVTVGRDLAQLVFRRLPGRADARVDGQEVLDVVEGHGGAKPNLTSPASRFRGNMPRPQLESGTG